MGAKKIRELRYRDPSGFSTTFTDASSGTWAPGTAVKLRTTAFDDSGLEFSAEPDAELQQDIYGRPAPIPTIRRGRFSFGTYLGSAESDATANPVATLLSKIMGGIDLPTARTDTAETDSTTTMIKCTAHGLAVGNAVLVGTRGDSAGNGEVRRVLTVDNADAFTVNMALSGAPANGAALVFSTTVYCNESATVTPLDFLAIGGDTEEQRQMIGCLGPFSIDQGNPGEVPQINCDFAAADWQWVPSGERDALTPTTASVGNNPPVDRGLGGFFLQDFGVTTRAVLKGGNLSIPAFMNFGEQPDANGVNGIGGYEYLPPESGVQVSFDLLYDQDMPGLYNDFANATGAQKKQLLLQFGHTAQRCVAIDLPACYLVGDPKTSELNGLSAIAVTVAAQVGTAGNKMSDTPIAIHFF